MELHGNISRNGYGNAVIGRYGGCFEKDVGLMCRRTGESSPTGCGCTGEVCTDSRGEKGQCTIPKRLAKYVWWKCQNQILDNAFVYRKTTSSLNVPQVVKTPQGGPWRQHKVPLASPTFAVTKPLGITFQLADFKIQKHYQLRLFNSERYGSTLY